MLIKCQQTDIFKIRDGIPKHGLQKAKFWYRSRSVEHVRLACGCELPTSWLPVNERQFIKNSMTLYIRTKEGFKQLRNNKSERQTHGT